jgi:ankyrin repeat protein
VHELVAAIHGGDLAALDALLAADPELARRRIESRGVRRTALHVATDWPGYFPNGPEVVRALLAAGADPNALTDPGPPETPLHWAASSDDVEVAAALIDGGADLEVPGGSIGTPLANAVGYGCWHVARLLVAHGVRVETLWHAAALGLRDRVEALLETASAEEIDNAFWQACHGGQRRTAELLLARGARLDAQPEYAAQSAIEVARAPDTQREALATWLESRRDSTDVR